MNKLAFLLSLLVKYLKNQNRDCPHCGSTHTVMKQRKKLLMELRLCQDCFLMYRYPKDEASDNLGFYQLNYQEGLTTDLPDETKIESLLKSNFEGFEVNQINASNNIKIIQKYTQSGDLLDYGCSWGYAVYQFNQAGYNSIGFEISKNRAEYGRKNLQVKIIDDFQDLNKLPDNSFDIIHTSHVLEHLPELQIAFTYFRKLLKPTGYLIIFVPNAGGKSAQNLGVDWGPMIGEKHNLALDARFFANSLPKHGFTCLFNSAPYDKQPIFYESKDQTDQLLLGDELLIIARLSDNEH